MGAGWCPPGMLGIGIGGTAEKAMLLAKQSLMDPIDMFDLLKRGPQNKTEELRIELYEKVNALGIGAQGLGGLSTVLDIKINMYPTHAASKPVAMIPNCAATRHAHFVLDGSGPAYPEPPSLDAWPGCALGARRQTFRRVDLNTLTKEEVASWKPGQTLLLNGKMLTGRDAAQTHQRHAGQGRKAAGGFHQPGHLLRRAGRPGARRGGRSGRPHHRHADGQVHRDDAGPDRPHRHGWQGGTRPGRHRSDQNTKRLPDGRRRCCVSGVEGIKGAKVLGFADLGMEAIYEFDVQDMPVTVAVDSSGTSVHQTGPKEWQGRDRQDPGGHRLAERLSATAPARTLRACLAKSP